MDNMASLALVVLHVSRNHPADDLGMIQKVHVEVDLRSYHSESEGRFGNGIDNFQVHSRFLPPNVLGKLRRFMAST